MRDVLDIARDHEALVAFLREQNEMGAAPNVQIFDPVVRTKESNIRIGDGSRIDSFVKLEGGTGLTIGRFVHIASFAHIGIGGGETIIGDFAAIASGGKVISGSNDPDAETMSACAPSFMQRVKLSKTVIDRYAVVLTNATVMPGVTLNEGAILAAGAVATRDIPAWEIWAGVPARFLRKRR
jgi:galactoside O-acetyltransferase